ncbi:MAG: GNAT family N-acetyltransferase [Acidimicrobiia bacterium]
MRLWVAREDEYGTVETLMREYVEWLPFDVNEFQDFEREMREIATEYGPPRGLAVLASLEDEPAGVAGVRSLTGRTAELKRMWVRPNARGRGLGKQLARRAVSEARKLGYRSVRLDTVADVMGEANRLYERLGFNEIDPYRDNPQPSARFMELDLDES